jgi:hypothetical protein
MKIYFRLSLPVGCNFRFFSFLVKKQKNNNPNALGRVSDCQFDRIQLVDSPSA